MRSRGCGGGRGVAKTPCGGVSTKLVGRDGGVGARGAPCDVLCQSSAGVLLQRRLLSALNRRLSSAPSLHRHPSCRKDTCSGLVRNGLRNLPLSVCRTSAISAGCFSDTLFKFQCFFLFIFKWMRFWNLLWFLRRYLWVVFFWEIFQLWCSYGSVVHSR